MILSELTYHEIIDALVDLFVQFLDEIRVCDTVDCTAEGVLLCDLGKFMRHVRERAVAPVNRLSEKESEG